MQDKIKNLIEKNEKVAEACTVCKAVWNVALVAVPAVISGYLILTNDDKIVIGVGAALAIYAAYRLWLNAYHAAKQPAKKGKK